MSKQAIQQVACIANEAVGQLDCASYQIAWGNSIAWAIKQALDNGLVAHAQKLAEVAQYLTDDYKFQLESDVESLTERVNALGLSA